MKLKMRKNPDWNGVLQNVILGRLRLIHKMILEL
jgi:hypothetical protein